MRLKRGKGDYRAPPIGLMVQATLDEGTYLFALMQVKPEEIDAQRQKTVNILGRPTMFALGKHGTTLMFWPAPDVGYKALLRYYPPMVEK